MSGKGKSGEDKGKAGADDGPLAARGQHQQVRAHRLEGQLGFQPLATDAGRQRLGLL